MRSESDAGPLSNATPEETYFWGYDQALRDSLRELLTAYELARDAGRTPWEFAIRMKVFRRHGLSESVVRWLICKRFIEHALETTRGDDELRTFRSSKQVKFKKRTCFVLTESGRALARSFLQNQPISPTTLAFPTQAEQVEQVVTPQWNTARHELHVGRYLVKRFRWPARNQEAILTALQEDCWPKEGIYDPLPPQADKDPKQRLRDTIKCLNRYQKQRLLRFRCDGTGERVLWELTPKALEALKADREADVLWKLDMPRSS